jgi:hypothetical protein
MTHPKRFMGFHNLKFDKEIPLWGAPAGAPRPTG